MKRWLGTIFITAFLSIGVSASHVSGVNISYECIGNDDYLITVNLFRDCEEQQNLPQNLSVYIGSPCINVGYKLFPQVDLQDVSQLCTAELPNSTCNSGIQPGVQLGVYQRIVTLEPCVDWRIVVSEQNRDEATVNLESPELFSVHVEAYLNNVDGSCNNSPQLSLLNLPYVCVGEPLFYNLGFIDADGDSLAYSLVPAQASETPNMPFELAYLAGYSGQEPITGMTIDPITGQIIVTPNSIGKFNTVVQVSEYRNGVLIGVVSYDFLILVNVCAIPPPEPDITSLAHISGGGYPLDQNTIGICEGDDFCFEMDFFSDDADISVSLSSNIVQLVPGATETVTGSNPATIQFCGSLPPDFEGGSFIITAIDDACPVYGQAFYTIDFNFRQPIQAFGDTVICLGESTPLSAINDLAYAWYTPAGGLLNLATGISCNPCQAPFVSPDTSTFYIVQGIYTNSSCPNTDTVFVDVPLSISTETVDESCSGNDGVIDITVLTGSGDYDVLWDDVGPAPLSRNDLAAGTYQVLIIDEIYGCNRMDSLSLDQMSSPTANAGVDMEVCGLSANLDAVPSYGTGTWMAISQVGISDVVVPNTIATVDTEGVFEFVWTEDAGEGCVDSDTVQVTFFEIPIVEISAADSVCGLEVALSANVSMGDFSWQSSTILSLDDNFILEPTASSTAYGDAQAILSSQNGLCTVSDTAFIRFIEQPFADAGLDIFVCANEATLSGNVGIGTGNWELPSALMHTGSLNQENLQVSTNIFGSYQAIWSRSNEGFCTAEDTVQVVFTEQPMVSLGNDTTLCGNSLALGFDVPAGDLEWQVSDNLDEIGTPQNGQLVSGEYGLHLLILQADNGFGCTDSDSIYVDFIEQPALLPVLADTACGLVLPLNAQNLAENSFWLPNADVTIENMNAAITSATASQQGGYTLQWVVLNGGHCSDTASYPLTFYDQPSADAGPDQTVCGLETMLEATPSAGTLLWMDVPGLTFENPLSSVTMFSAGSFGQYSVIVNEVNGICTSSDEVEINFVSSPEFQNVTWECTGSDALFVLSFNLAYGDTNDYALSGIEGILNDFSFVSDPLLSDTPVEAIIFDGGICGGDTIAGTLFCPIITSAGSMSQDTIRVCGDQIVSAPPALAYNLDGNDNLLYAFHDGSSNTLGAIYDWNAAPEFSYEAPLAFNQTYFISAVAGNEMGSGIDLSDPNLSVAVGTPVGFYEVPYASLTGEFLACTYDTLYLPLNLTGPFPQEITYSIQGNLWTETATANNFEILAGDSGQFSLIGVQTDFCVGEASGSASLQYHALPEAILVGTPSICAGDTSFLAISIQGSAPFSFHLEKNGNQVADFQGPSPDFSFLAMESGNYTIIELTDENCVASDTTVFFLEVRPLPVVDAGSDLVLCTGDTVAIGSSYLTGQSYHWSGEGPLSDFNIAQPLFFAANESPFPTLFNLFLEAELDACFVTDTLNIAVYSPPIPQIAGNTELCAGDSVLLSGFGADSIRWEPALYFSDPQGSQTYFSASSDTDIIMSAFSAVGCEASTSTQISVNPMPSSGFSVSDLEGCAPFTTQLIAFDNNAGYQYLWEVEGFSALADAPELELIFSERGSYELSLKVITNKGCTSIYRFPEAIQVHDIAASFSYSPQLPSISSPEVYFQNHSPWDAFYTWSFDSLASSSAFSPLFIFPTDVGGNYEICLDAVSPEGCTDRYCEVIAIKDDFFIYVPNAFSPDGDGLNDLFFPVLAQIDVVEYHFWITDRKGVLVFETFEMGKKWNGSRPGSEYYGDNNVYTWHLVAKPDFNVETKTFSGQVLLLR